MEKYPEKYDGVEKMTRNRFLNLYHIHARTTTGRPFDYYFASRNDEEHIKHKTHSMEAEGMAIYALSLEREYRIVLIRQYRYPINDYIYELPAGLMEPGELPHQAAVRELREETGYQFVPYTQGMEYYRRPYFLAVGMSDESGTIVYGTVEGCGARDGLEDSEDIEVILADKTEVRRILREERVSCRAGLLLIQFLQGDMENPFGFLDN